MLIAFLIFALISGVLIWVSLWLQPARGTCVMILYAGYEDNVAVPHNLYGRKGAEALGQLAAGNAPSSSLWSSGRLTQRFKERPLDGVDDWSQNLSKVREKTLLLYFAVHGGADCQGAYLLPQGAADPQTLGRADAAKQLLRLETVLDRLHA